jgi:LysR family glycine cleavage system transcriptional activator
MSKRLPPLYALRAFEAAARQGGFLAAAQELHVTSAAVSQQVKALEDHLGIALFDRKPRGVVLTEVGTRYGAQLTRLFAELAEATQGVYRRAGEVLTIFTSPTFATRWLIPRLAGFHRAEPSIQVRVLVESDGEHLASRDLDLTIQYGDGRCPGAIEALPFPGTVFPVCAPTLLGNRKPPLTLAELQELPLMRLDDARFPAGFHDHGWRRWLHAAGVTAPADAKGPSFSHVHMMLLAAAAGQGMAIASLAVAGDDLAAGRLLRPVAEEIAVTNRYWLSSARTQRAQPPQKVLLFRDWLVEETRRFVADHAAPLAWRLRAHAAERRGGKS